MYTYICISINIHMYINLYIYTYICTQTNIWISRVHISVLLNAIRINLIEHTADSWLGPSIWGIYIYIYVYTYKYIYTHIYVYICIYIYTYTYTYVHACDPNQSNRTYSRELTWLLERYVYIHTHIHITCMYICMHLHVIRLINYTADGWFGSFIGAKEDTPSNADPHRARADSLRDMFDIKHQNNTYIPTHTYSEIK